MRLTLVWVGFRIGTDFTRIRIRPLKIKPGSGSDLREKTGHGSGSTYYLPHILLFSFNIKSPYNWYFTILHFTKEKIDFREIFTSMFRLDPEPTIFFKNQIRIQIKHLIATLRIWIRFFCLFNFDPDPAVVKCSNGLSVAPAEFFLQLWWKSFAFEPKSIRFFLFISWWYNVN